MNGKRQAAKRELHLQTLIENAPEALRASDERYQTLVDLSPDAMIVVVGEDCAFANAAAARLVGARSPAELVGRNCLDFIAPEYRALIADRMKQILAGAPTIPREIKVLRLDGTVVEVDAVAARVQFDGGPAIQVIYRDITERKQMERSLQLTQLSVDQAVDAVNWIAPDGHLLYVNDAYCRSHGYSREELLDMTVFDLAPDLTPETWHDRWPKRKEYGAVKFEVMHRRKDGEVFPVEVTSRIVEHSGAQLDVGFVRDISERRAAEAALTHSHDLMRYIIEHDRSAVAVLDKNLTYIYVSQRFLEQRGLAGQKVLGRQHYDVFPNLPEKWVEAHRRALAGEVVSAEDDPVVWQNGTLDWTRWECRPWYEADGSIGGIVLYTEIITERKRTEEVLRAASHYSRSLIEASLDPLVTISLEGKITDVNQATVQVTGRSRDDLIGTDFCDYFTDPESARQGYQEVFATGAVIDYPLTIRHRDGKTTDVLYNASVYKDQAGEVLGVFAAARDITERKAAEEALRASEEQLRQAQKMEAIGQLAGGIAHDFNNVLTTIIGYSDLILTANGDSAESLRGDIEEIKNAAERASSLTRQILAFSRRQALKPELLSINEVVRGTERLLRRTLGEDVDLVMLLSSDPGLVEVDPHQMEQVLMNLAVNARDAMPGGGKLTLETTNVELGTDYCRTHPGTSPGSFIMLAVSDTGWGMDEETRSRIFEPFFTTKEVGKGTGLGLSTVYGVVKQSGGNILVYSEPGVGTTFKIYLPRADQSATEHSRSSGSSRSTAGHETILVVEDEAAVRELVKRALERLGYTVVTASSGDEALAVLMSDGSRLDLLLTDVVLPGGLQGHELAREAASLWPDLPVLFMSGYTRNAIVHSGRLDRGINYIEKPFTPENLGRYVRQVLESRPHAARSVG